LPDCYKLTSTEKSGTVTTFTNTYSTKGEIALSGTKELEFRTLKEGEFTFRLCEPGFNVYGNPIWKTVEVTTNDANGKYSFETIKYTGKDLDVDETTGQYVETTKQYKIVEVVGTDANIDYNPERKEYIVTVTLKDNGRGTIETKATPDNGTYAFKNTYKTKGEITLHGTKELAFRKLVRGEFIFALYEQDGTDRDGNPTWKFKEDTKKQ
jgi:hypothetical protein